jgi:hypothetical protein
MSRKNHPKCANPACPAAYHRNAGGKFFRFRPEPTFAPSRGQAADPRPEPCEVKHYWLCECCSYLFTLAYDRECEVVLKLVQRERPAEEACKLLTAA